MPVPDEPGLPEALDRSLLNVMVAGAGFGETVVVALPERGWIVVDGAGPHRTPQARRLLERYTCDDEPIELLLLTHPHADHYYGFVEMLDDARLGPLIRKIGCVGEYLGGPADRTTTLAREVEAALQGLDQLDPNAWRELGRARNVLERIAAEWRRNPDRVFQAKANARLSLGAVSLTVLSPAPHQTQAFFEGDDLATRIRTRANDLSVTVHLDFGDTRVLLGSDLPERVNRVTVESGWTSVRERTAELAAHHAYKVAHHGSANAIPEAMHRTAQSPRLWTATPYNRGAGLPRFEDGEGVEQLLQLEPELHLTGMPVSTRAQLPMPPAITRSALLPRLREVRGPLGALGPPVATGAIGVASPEQCVWAFAMDAEGRRRGVWRGSAATIVTE